MSKVLKLYEFALKELLEYKRNLILGVFSMVANDLLFLMMFVIFLSYFKGIDLNMGDMFLIWSFAAGVFGATHGIFYNVSKLQYIIEGGKLDYYLSLPYDIVKIILLTKLDSYGIGDVVFGVISFFIYYFFFTDLNRTLIPIRFILVLLCIVFMLGFHFLTASLSFWLDRGSQISNFLQDFMATFATWPFKIYQDKKVVYFICAFLGLYPSMFLPYNIIKGDNSILSWILVIVLNAAMGLIGHWIFMKGLKKYSSGNLITQM